MLRVKDISLFQFKNYSRADFVFHERIVGICGNNGVGKTNLLDALYYLCFTKSYFSRSDQQSVFRGAAGFRLEGRLDIDGKVTELVAILREGRVLVPQSQDPLQPGDELFFVTSQDVEVELEQLFASE